MDKMIEPILRENPGGGETYVKCVDQEKT